MTMLIDETGCVQNLSATLEGTEMCVLGSGPKLLSHGCL